MAGTSPAMTGGDVCVHPACSLWNAVPVIRTLAPRHGRACPGHPRDANLVTSDLGRRVWQHRTAAFKGFTQRYGLGRLVWYEPFSDIRDAIQREHTMKHWRRAWKVRPSSFSISIRNGVTFTRI